MIETRQRRLPRKRWWVLGTMLLVTLGVGVRGWWHHEREQRAVAAIEALGGEVSLYVVRPPIWLRDVGSPFEHVFGEQGASVYLGGTQATDADLEHLKGLASLRVLHLDGTQISDTGLEHFKGLTKLRWLGLRYTQVTAAGVKKLQQALPNCTIVYEQEEAN